ncbi:MAG: FmdB family zinc ribbon protein [Phycisphaeraceae bacterium]
MPIYEYACEQCDAVTEALRKMSEADEPIVCEKCGSDRTKRAHSVFAAGSGDGGGDMSLPVGGPGGCPCGDPNGPCNL